MFGVVPWCCLKCLWFVVHSPVVCFVLVAFVHSPALVVLVHSAPVASAHPAAAHSTMAGKEEDDYPSIHGKAMTAQTSEFQRRDSCS